MARLHRIAPVLLFVLMRVVLAIQVDFNDPQSIKSAASTVAYGLVSYYKGNESGQTPGELPYPPYFWWESGAMWGALIDYWSFTGDATYNDITSQGILFQVGNDNDFMPQNQSFDMGNDDQAYWAFTALTAAEANFPNPPSTEPSWLSLAQAVFNEQIGRWDNSTCGGGLHWQVFQAANGYHLKNTPSNGALFQIAARLARYTHDEMYAQWAVKIWDWMWAVGLVDNVNYMVYDNTDTNNNCTTLDRQMWTYNGGTMLAGCAIMFNYTGDPIWANRTANILKAVAVDYFPNGIMIELCEASGQCDPDQQTFKTFLSRWMATTVQMAPFTEPTITPLLRNSAAAAMQQCDGSFFPDHTSCGQRWSQNATWDGSNGPGQQMAALEILLSTIIKTQQVPLTNSTGGTSISDPTAGHNASSVAPGTYMTPPTHRGRVGAWALTAVLIVASLCGTWFMVSDGLESGTSGLYKRRVARGKGRAVG